MMLYRTLVYDAIMQQSEMISKDMLFLFIGSVFSCEEAALEVLMSLCLSVYVSVYQFEIQPVNRGMNRDGHYN